MPSPPRSLTEPVLDRVITPGVHLPLDPDDAFRWFTEPPRLESWRTAKADVEPRGTSVHLLHSRWRSAPEWEEARSWRERAWSLGLAWLEGGAREGSRGVAPGSDP
jgi:hypothetical protein